MVLGLSGEFDGLPSRPALPQPQMATFAFALQDHVVTKDGRYLDLGNGDWADGHCCRGHKED